MPLHIDYRPTTLDEIIGNRTTIDSLKIVLRKLSRPHSYLFSGPAGCGKTTLARIAASMVDCSEFDVKELNSADFRGIDSIRDILRKMRLSSLSKGTNRAWILDEAHKLTGDAQNALLKALEEPPPHVYFFLCTTDPQMLLKTIRSRCSLFEVELLTKKQMCDLLRQVAAEDEKTIPEEVLEQIASDSQGAPREALTLLEKIIDLPEKRMLRAAKQSIQIENQAIDLCRSLIAGHSWDKVKVILKGLEKEDPESVRRMVLDYACKVLLGNDSGQAYLVLDAFREPFYNTGRAGLILACYEALEG